MSCRISKLRAAQRTLDLAIRLHLDEEDKLGILSLAYAAFRVLLEFSRAVQAPSSLSKNLEDYRRNHKALFDFMVPNEIANFSKHADRDPFDELDDFSIEDVEDFLILTVKLFSELSPTISKEMRAVLFIERKKDTDEPTVRWDLESEVAAEHPDDIEFEARQREDARDEFKFRLGVAKKVLSSGRCEDALMETSTAFIRENLLHRLETQVTKGWSDLDVLRKARMKTTGENTPTEDELDLISEVMEKQHQLIQLMDKS